MVKRSAWSPGDSASFYGSSYCVLRGTGEILRAGIFAYEEWNVAAERDLIVAIACRVYPEATVTVEQRR
jgi:hypothetical protein